MSRNTLSLIGIAGAIALAAVACSETNGGSGAGGGANTGGASSGTNTGGGTGTNTGSGTGGDINISVGVGGSTGSGTVCDSMPGDDKDMDGWTVMDGDCNDCDPNVNPGAIEVINTTPDMNGNIPPPADEDCDGTKDNVAPTCDDTLIMDDLDPMHAANAIDLCQVASATDKKWGVLDAKYVGAGGDPRMPGLQTGILDKFGANVKVQMGKRMLGLSSGHARDMLAPLSDQCGAQTCNNGTDGTAPAGFPQNIANCPPKTDIHDDIALELKLRAPSNATGYKFLFKFHSFEFPEWVCMDFNDQFIALVDPAPMGSINGNISFDKNNNPVSVNIAFFDVCDPAGFSNFAKYCNATANPNCPGLPSPYCPSGASQLAFTGFGTTASTTEWGDGGATSWLQTQAPVGGGEEFTIRFAIWDTGDHNLDSTVLVDGFQWIATGGTVVVGTDKVPIPK